MRLGRIGSEEVETVGVRIKLLLLSRTILRVNRSRLKRVLVAGHVVSLIVLCLSARSALR
jgi:hypothetical protein